MDNVGKRDVSCASCWPTDRDLDLDLGSDLGLISVSDPLFYRHYSFRPEAVIAVNMKTAGHDGGHRVDFLI